MNKIIVAIIAIVLIAGGGYLVSHKKTNTPSATSQTSSQSQNTPASSTSVAATITYASNGFSPGTVTVKSGDTVAIKNISSDTMQLQSDPHPVHTDDTDLNVGTVNAGQTVTFTVTKKGTFGFHNHLNPSYTGKITIE